MKTLPNRLSVDKTLKVVMLRLPEEDYQSWRTGKTTTERGYDGRWRKARDGYLRRHPLCAYCEREGKVTAATILDHVIPHLGNMQMFWDRDNWQPLCKPCHDVTKAREEGRGKRHFNVKKTT